MIRPLIIRTMMLNIEPCVFPLNVPSMSSDYSQPFLVNAPESTCDSKEKEENPGFFSKKMIDPLLAFNLYDYPKDRNEYRRAYKKMMGYLKEHKKEQRRKKKELKRIFGENKELKPRI